MASSPVGHPPAAGLLRRGKAEEEACSVGSGWGWVRKGGEVGVRGCLGDIVFPPPSPTEPMGRVEYEWDGLSCVLRPPPREMMVAINRWSFPPLPFPEWRCEGDGGEEAEDGGGEGASTATAEEEAGGGGGGSGGEGAAAAEGWPLVGGDVGTRLVYNNAEARRRAMGFLDSPAPGLGSGCF